MASLSNHKDGRRTIYTSGPGRPKIALGRIPKKQAEAIVRHVEALEASRIDGSAPPKATAEWLAGASRRLRERLVTLGLSRQAVPIGQSIAKVIETVRSDRFPTLKPSTQRLYEKAFRHLEKGATVSMPVEAFTEGHAKAFRGWLLREKPSGAGLAESTANKQCSIAWTVFETAVDYRLIDRNPFRKVPRGNLAAQHEFVAADKVQAVLRSIACTEMRLLIALSRWGGLRVPSEPRMLTWGDVDWAGGRFIVNSPKTERFRGHESRIVPIFPELMPFLEQRYEAAQEGDKYVLPMMRRYVDATFSGRLDRACKLAGVERWSRIWHNMRSTRQTELEEKFPTHVVCAWLGNSEATAKRHYLQVTEEHFRQGALLGAECDRGGLQRDASSPNADSQVPCDA